MPVFADEVRTWRRDGFTLELFDTHDTTGSGRQAHTLLAYRLRDGEDLIFEGDQFSPPLSDAIDPGECMPSLLF